VTPRLDYYARRSLGVAVGAALGGLLSALTFLAFIWGGSRFGEWLAGGRQVLVNNHGRIEVVNEDA
jgi:hypothetical protein